MYNGPKNPHNRTISKGNPRPTDLKASFIIKGDDGDGMLFWMRPSDGGRIIRIRDGCRVLQYDLDEEDLKSLREWVM